MKSHIRLVFAAVLGALAGVLLATTAPTMAQKTEPVSQVQPPVGEFKVGIVDLQTVMDAYKKRQDEVAKLEQEFKVFQDKLDKMAEDLKQKKDQYEKDKDTLTEQEREASQTKMEADWLDLRSETQRIQADFEGRQLRLKKQLLKDMVAAIERIGIEENYHLILEADPESRTGVIFFSPTLTITQKVIDRLNSGGA